MITLYRKMIIIDFAGDALDGAREDGDDDLALYCCRLAL